MRTKTEPKIIISLIIALVILSVACINPIKGIQTRQKCGPDADCPGAYCSENFRKVVVPTCMDGRCQDIATECAESDICVADSLGVRCLPQDPVTKKAILSCGNNTLNPGLIPFNKAGYVCGDDCPKESYCSDDCICLLREEISCGENTQDTEDFGMNIFDVNTEICKDDCPYRFDCSDDCVCEEICPYPVFTNNYFDPPPIDISLGDLMLTWLEDPESVYSWVGDTINVFAYEHERDGEFYWIPFADEQLERVPNPENEYIPQYGAFCVNDYYEGDKSMDIDFQWLDRPEVTCIWGGAEGSEGVLTVCTEYMLDWLEAYTESQ